MESPTTDRFTNEQSGDVIISTPMYAISPVPLEKWVSNMAVMMHTSDTLYKFWVYKGDNAWKHPKAVRALMSRLLAERVAMLINVEFAIRGNHLTTYMSAPLFSVMQKRMAACDEMLTVLFQLTRRVVASPKEGPANATVTYNGETHKQTRSGLVAYTLLTKGLKAACSSCMREHQRALRNRSPGIFPVASSWANISIAALAAHARHITKLQQQEEAALMVLPLMERNLRNAIVKRAQLANERHADKDPQRRGHDAFQKYSKLLRSYPQAPAPQSGNNKPSVPQSGNNKPSVPQGNNRPSATQGNNRPSAPQSGNNQPSATQGNNQPSATQSGNNQPLVWRKSHSTKRAKKNTSDKVEKAVRMLVTAIESNDRN